MFNPFRYIFKERHAILPVVHAQTVDQTLRNAAIAYEEGCDGIFLINHDISYHALIESYETVRRFYPAWWIGLNCLDLSPDKVFARIPPSVSGIWVDNAGIHESAVKQPEAELIDQARRISGWQGLYFGGVAFKYQPLVRDYFRAARHAREFMDVITTSGPGTGQPAPRDKILSMRPALPNVPLAIASGITPDNVYQYLDLADCFLVATGISCSFHDLDRMKVRKLVRNIRTYEGGVTGNDTLSSRRMHRPDTICFVCEWNEGRSPHLELSTRLKLKQGDSPVRVCSAGLKKGGGINPLRGEFLRMIGVPEEEIRDFRSTVFDDCDTHCELILTADLTLKETLLKEWPQCRQRVMTIKGYAMGFTPFYEPLTAAEACLADSGDFDSLRKRQLYQEAESLAEQVVKRLIPWTDD